MKLRKTKDIQVHCLSLRKRTYVIDVRKAILHHHISSSEAGSFGRERDDAHERFQRVFLPQCNGKGDPVLSKISQRKENKAWTWPTPMSPKPHALLSQSSSMQRWQLMCKMFQAYASYCNFHNYILLPSVPSTRISRTAENIRGIVIAPDLELALTSHRALCTRKFWKIEGVGFQKKRLHRHVTKTER